MNRIKITTINPAKPGLICRVVENENEENILVDGILNAGGAYFEEIEADPNMIVVLLLINDEGKELIRCRVPIKALDPMECFMTNPKRLSVDEAHKRFMAKHRELKRLGVGNPDADAVARAAFM